MRTIAHARKRTLTPDTPRPASRRWPPADMEPGDGAEEEGDVGDVEGKWVELRDAPHTRMILSLSPGDGEDEESGDDEDEDEESDEEEEEESDGGSDGGKGGGGGGGGGPSLVVVTVPPTRSDRERERGTIER